MSASEQVHELVQWPDRLEPYLPVGDSLARVTDLAMRPYQAMVALNVLLAILTDTDGGHVALDHQKDAKG